MIILFKCKSCEKNGDEPCYTIGEFNPNRKKITPTYCMNDGRGARWVESKDYRFLRKVINLQNKK